jgi:peptidoglycan hydrolase-like protein with peptidoglycan-binding domain
MAAKATKRHAHKSSPRRALIPVLAGLVLAVGLVAGGCELLGSHHTGLAGNDNGDPHTTSSNAPVTSTPTLRMLWTTPRGGDGAVAFSPVITLRFSAPLAADSIHPRLSPPIRGTWQTAGDEMVFRPAGNLSPYTGITVTVPGGTRGIEGATGAFLETGTQVRYRVRGASELRLQELLAELGYLPVAFVPGTNGPTQAATTSDVTGSSTTTTTSSSTTTTTPTTTSTSTTTTTTAPPPTTTTTTSPPGPPPPDTEVVPGPPAGHTSVQEPHLASDIPLVALPGHFVWRYTDIPASLQTLWSAGNPNEITTAAVMSFESANGLPWDGLAGPQVWSDLLKAVAARHLDTSPYNYVYVSTASTEYIDLWSDGQVIFQSLANTGIPAAPTQAGTWPVYARYLVTTMSGTNPNGTKYDDTGIKWVSYFHGGDALHFSPRPGYGYPQSLGCVELPYTSAETLFPYTPIGTLVTVEASAVSPTVMPPSTSQGP